MRHAMSRNMSVETGESVCDHRVQHLVMEDSFAMLLFRRTEKDYVAAACTFAMCGRCA